jgi:isopenicillin-N epimerase
MNPFWGADWPEVRQHWDLDLSVRHLNHGSYGAVPRPVREAQDGWRHLAEENPNRFFARALPALLPDVRERVSRFVGADPARCVLVPNVTFAISTVLASSALRPGDEVVLTADTYPGVRAAIETACRRSGATPVVAQPAAADDLGPESLVDAIRSRCSPRTRLAFIDHITSPTAIVMPVAQLAGELHERGVTVVVDGAHAPGAVPLRVDDIGADYYAGNFHKWCCAPRGAAFLAVSASAIPRLISGVVGSRSDEGFPSGMEWWGTADYSALLSAPAALDFLEGLGVDRVQRHNSRLVEHGAQLVAAALGAPAPCMRAAPMASIPLGPMTANDAEGSRSRLAACGVEAMVACARSHGYLRLSAHVYNSPAEYEYLADQLPSAITARGTAPSPAVRRSFIRSQ